MAVTNVDPATIAQKWAQNLGAAGNRIQAGVEAVTVATGQAAARNSAGYLAGVQANANKWKQKVAAVSLSDWQQAMINKGVQRVGTGATAAQDKFSTFMGKLLTFERSLASTLPARGTTDANIQRAVAWMQGMAKARGQF